MNSKAFPFHDGYLVSVSVGEDTATLGLKQVDGGTFVMTLRGLEALTMDGFGKGNIILDLWTVSGKEPTREDLATMEVTEVMEMQFPGPHPSAAAQYHETHAAFLATRLARIHSGDAALVLLAPAFGAELYAFVSRSISSRHRRRTSPNHPPPPMATAALGHPSSAGPSTLQPDVPKG